MLNIFDIDNTVLKKTTTWYFLLESFSQKIIKFSQIRGLPLEWLRYKLGRPNQMFIEEAIKKLAGIDKTILEDVAQSCFENYMKKNIFLDAYKLINEMHQRKEKVIFASSSFYTLIQPLERFLGSSESVASALEFAQGKTTGRVVGESCFGISKKNAVEAWFNRQGQDPQDACFYTDSYTDLPLMEYCGQAVAVNPDRILEQAAKKHGWKILHFKKTLGR